MFNTLIEMYSYGFMQNALAVGVIGGSLLAFLGIFVHLRRVVFLGAALPQIIALGIAVAVFFNFALIPGAVLGGVVGILLLSLPGKSSRIPPDGWIGLAFAAGNSVAIVIIALSPAPDGTVLRFFTGDVLGTSRLDAIAALAAAIPIFFLFWYFWNRFIMTGFDPVMSATLGIRTRMWDALLFLCLGIGLAVVMNTAGGMLAFSMLVGPPAAALLMFRNFTLIIPVAIIFGILASFSGLTLSFLYDLPGGPAMAAMALVPVPFALLVRRFIQN